MRHKTCSLTQYKANSGVTGRLTDLNLRRNRLSKHSSSTALLSVLASIIERKCEWMLCNLRVQAVGTSARLSTQSIPDNDNYNSYDTCMLLASSNRTAVVTSVIGGCRMCMLWQVFPKTLWGCRSRRLFRVRGPHGSTESRPFRGFETLIMQPPPGVR